MTAAFFVLIAGLLSGSLTLCMYALLVLFGIMAPADSVFAVILLAVFLESIASTFE